MIAKTAEINKSILKLAIPNMISNIVIPMLGMVDTAIAGYIGQDINIAALSIGTTIFSFIYWNCAFLRMGTSGITAQAYGSGDLKECANMLIRALWLACIMACLLLVFQKPIGLLALRLLQGSDAVRQVAGEYFFIRIWAVPASITLFAIQGWFIGMQDAKTPMLVAIFSVFLNIILSIIFVFGLNMGIAGIAWSTVGVQYISLAIFCILWLVRYRSYMRYFDIKASFHFKPMVRFLQVNQDIFLRTACVVIVYTFFTAASARFGDTILATNALLMQLFTLFSYLADGFAYAGEALSGRLVGERNTPLLKRYIRLLLLWSLVVAIVFVIIYILAWKNILILFSPSDEVLRTAGQYIIWIIAVPLVGCIPFMIDGIMIGATQTKLLRNTVFFATLLFFGSFYALAPLFGNDALWISFLLFLFFRGLLLYFCSNKLNVEQIVNRRSS